AGVIAANNLNRAAPDGLTLGVPGRSWFVVGAVNNPAAKFDPATMSYVGSSGVVNSALWMRPDSGIASFADLLAAREKVVLGAISATSQVASRTSGRPGNSGWVCRIGTTILRSIRSGRLAKPSTIWKMPGTSPCSRPPRPAAPSVHRHGEPSGVS